MGRPGHAAKGSAWTASARSARSRRCCERPAPAPWPLPLVAALRSSRAGCRSRCSPGRCSRASTERSSPAASPCPCAPRGRRRGLVLAPLAAATGRRGRVARRSSLAPRPGDGPARLARLLGGPSELLSSVELRRGSRAWGLHRAPLAAARARGGGGEEGGRLARAARFVLALADGGAGGLAPRSGRSRPSWRRGTFPRGSRGSGAARAARRPSSFRPSQATSPSPTSTRRTPGCRLAPRKAPRATCGPRAAPRSASPPGPIATSRRRSRW